MIKFICAYCPAPPFRSFKELVDHYQEHHTDNVKRYEIRRKDRKAIALIYATSEEEAYRLANWPREDCKIEEVQDVKR